MAPLMAQGACMAIEDAVVLSRALAGATRADVPAALRAYEDARRDRTARVQLGSLANDLTKGQGNADWVYGHDARAAPLWLHFRLLRQWRLDEMPTSGGARASRR